jgi:hypothetical protein
LRRPLASAGLFFAAPPARGRAVPLCSRPGPARCMHHSAHSALSAFACRCTSSRSSRTSGRRAFVQARRRRCLARRCMFVRVCRTRAALPVPFNRRATVVCVATRCNTFQHVVLHEKRVQDSTPAVPLPRSLGRSFTRLCRSRAALLRLWKAAARWPSAQLCPLCMGCMRMHAPCGRA